MNREFPKPKHNVKDSLFAFIIRKKKYLLALYKSIHPEDEGVREEEIELVNITPLFYPSLMNDCSFLVRDKLLVLIEAQSTWTENIKHRLMEYYVSHYRTLIPDYEKKKYRGTVIDMPDFEFNVFYTGTMPVEDQLYMTENRPGREMDLKKPYIPVNVYTRYNITGFAKQFFDFVCLYDDFCRKYGRSHTAVEKTIKACLEGNILRELIMEHMSEVIRFMDDYNEELIKGWIEDTVQEKIACEKDTLLAKGEAIGEAKGEAKGEARGYNQRQEEIITKLQNSGLTQEQKELFMSLIGTGNR